MNDERKLRKGEFEDIVKNFEGPPDQNSDLFMVTTRNPYVRRGKYVFLYNEGFQEVELVQAGRADGSAAVQGSRGRLWRLRQVPDALFIPRETLMPFVTRMPRRA